MTSASDASRPSFADPFAHDVSRGLGSIPKSLPSTYLYDRLGSDLFDRICDVDEYGLSRAGTRLIAAHGPALSRALPDALQVVELGAGTGRKTRRLLECLTAPRQDTRYFPIDVAESALQVCAEETGTIPKLSIAPLTCTYLEGMQQAASQRRPNESMLVLFLGSTIGNFERPEASAFLSQVHGFMRPHDSLLLATDLVKADESVMVRAYDDAQGLTEAFNLNVLTHINDAVGGNFAPQDFAHEARYNRRLQRIEMHLRCRRDHEVHAAGERFTFRTGETIHTESSHKFTLRDIDTLARHSGFTVDESEQWCDAEWPFAHTLLRYAAA